MFLSQSQRTKVFFLSLYLLFRCQTSLHFKYHSCITFPHAPVFYLKIYTANISSNILILKVDYNRLVVQSIQLSKIRLCENIYNTITFQIITYYLPYFNLCFGTSRILISNWDKLLATVTSFCNTS